MTIRFSRALRTSIALSFLMLVFGLFDLAMAQDKRSYLPNPKLTPGATLDVTRDDLCEGRDSNPVPAIPIALKRQVFDRYGIRAEAPVGYDIDHLIPIGLGGSNSIKNLWPQPLTGEWNHLMKDKLEHRLHRMLCRGQVDLKSAQQEIAADWVSAYKKYIIQSAKAHSRRR